MKICVFWLKIWFCRIFISSNMADLYLDPLAKLRDSVIQSAVFDIMVAGQRSGPMENSMNISELQHMILLSATLSQDMIQSYIHARSVLPIVYICTLGACSKSRPTRAQSVWADARSERLASLTFKVCGPRVTFQMHWPWVSILAHGWCAYLYLDVRRMFATKLTKIVQLIIRSKRLGQPHVQSVWAERHLSKRTGQWSPY